MSDLLTAELIGFTSFQREGILAPLLINKVNAFTTRQLRHAAHSRGFVPRFATNGHFVTLIYHAKFARGAAEENFTFRIDNGRASLVGYHITTPGAAPI